MVRLELIVVGPPLSFFFFFNDTATTEIYTLSLHDALPICMWAAAAPARAHLVYGIEDADSWATDAHKRSEEHTSELQSRLHLVCRLLLEKKKKTLPRFSGAATRTQTGSASLARHSGSAVSY